MAGKQDEADILKFLDARKKRIAWELETTPGILSKLYEREDFARIAHNVDLMSRSILLRGMMALRVEKNIEAALADFRLGCDLGLELEKTVGIMNNRTWPEKIRPQTSFLNVQDFEFVLYLCLLSGNWDQALKTASLSRNPAVIDRDDLLNSVMSRLFIAFLCDDKEKFTEYHGKYYAKVKKNRWWKYFLVYVDLYESVLNRDQPRFDALMEEAEKQFLARSRDRKFGDLRPEYGGQKENALVLDFMSLGIAVVAMKRGMNVARDTDVFPRSLVEHLI